MSGSKHGGPDSLSRCLRGDDDSESDEEDVEDIMDADLAALRGEAERDDDEQVEAAEEDEEVEGENKHERATGDDTPDNNVPSDFGNVIHYLTTFERREGLTCKKYLQFQCFATKFLLQDGILFRRTKSNMLPKRIVWNLEDRNNIISELYDESRYRGRQSTYAKVALHYWWLH